MKSKIFVLGLIVLMLIGGLVLAGCGPSCLSGDDGSGVCYGNDCDIVETSCASYDVDEGGYIWNGKKCDC